MFTRSPALSSGHVPPLVGVAVLVDTRGCVEQSGKPPRHTRLGRLSRAQRCSRLRRGSRPWVQPRVVCNRPGSSASFWVGLGGAKSNSAALEQIGTSADCSERALVSHSALYQLFPAPAVELPLTIRPGDAISASVAVRGTTVTLVPRQRNERGRLLDRARDAVARGGFGRVGRRGAVDVFQNLRATSARRLRGIRRDLGHGRYAQRRDPRCSMGE
jgi:Peptidase A4 family